MMVTVLCRQRVDVPQLKLVTTIQTFTFFTWLEAIIFYVKNKVNIEKKPQPIDQACLLQFIMNIIGIKVTGTYRTKNWAYLYKTYLRLAFKSACHLVLPYSR